MLVDVWIANEDYLTRIGPCDVPETIDERTPLISIALKERMKTSNVADDGELTVINMKTAFLRKFRLTYGGAPRESWLLTTDHLKEFLEQHSLSEKISMKDRYVSGL